MSLPAREAGASSQPHVRAGMPRAAEALLALVALALAAPLLVIAGGIILVTSGGPVLFRQERVGRYGKFFLLYKLRTMRPGPCGAEVTASDDGRITAFGRFLRRAKLDEVPQFWNVLKGDMSLVGPRPEVARYVNMENPLWGKVLQVRPGITDPATLRLRNEEAILAAVRGDRERFYREELQPDKLRDYLDYLQRRSWRTDLGILCQTGLAVLFPKGRRSR